MVNTPQEIPDGTAIEQLTVCLGAIDRKELDVRAFVEIDEANRHSTQQHERNGH